MRLNRGTIALVVVALIVIVAVSVLNNNQAAAPGVTPTAQAQAGPLWPGVDAGKIVRLEVRDNTTGKAIALNKDAGGNWTVGNGSEEAMTSSSASMVSYLPPQDFPIDTGKITNSVGAFAGLQAADQFESDAVADFGLANPMYTIFAVTSENAVYAVHVGSKNPNKTRYYAVSQQIAGANVTPEATDMLPSRVINNEGNGASAGEPTALPVELSTEEVGANPTMDALANNIAEATSEAAMTEAAEAFSAAVSATNTAAGANANPEATSAVEMTAEATAAMAATDEATAEATAATEPTAEATPALLAEPLVALTGNQTIFLLPQDVVTSLVAYLTTPPYVLPTATPTLPPTANPYSEVQQTATASVQQTAVMAQMQATLQVMQQTATAQAAATAEVTATPAAGGS